MKSIQGYKQDGFRGETLIVLPPESFAAYADHPVVRRLHLTDAGYFPRAAGKVARPQGIAENILLCCTDGRGVVEVDGVLFSGGPDIHPGLYGEELLDCCGALAPERDALEIPLMQKAIAIDKPVFGICRGFQVLNVVTGGTMYQDINTQNKSSVHIEHQRTKPEEKDKVMHKVNVIRDTPLHTFSEGLLQIGVNTLHHQGVKKLGEPLRSMAIADDGIVEAAYYPGKKFVMGVQWHPEILGLGDKVANNLFTAFVEACAQNMK